MSQPRVGSWTPGPPFALPLLCPPPVSADVHSFLKCAQRWHPHRFIDESFPQKTLPLATTWSRGMPRSLV